MKLWRIIWAIYVLVLSGMPCAAFCLDESTAKTEQAPSSTANDHSHDEECSPFCLCATCPGFTLPPSPHIIRVVLSVVPVVVAMLPSYQASHTLDVPGRIWQPPRLV